MTMSADRLRLLHGSATPIPEMRALRAGPVTMLLDGIDLRYLRIGGTELVRRVYAAVRDVDWDTVPGVVSNLEVEQGDGSFRVEFDARHARPCVWWFSSTGWTRSSAAAKRASGVCRASNSSHSPRSSAAWSAGSSAKIRSAAASSRSRCVSVAAAS